MNLDEREQAFFTWKQATRVANKPNDKTIRGYIRLLRTIARVERVNLDDEFINDELASLLQRYTYPIANERAGVPDPTNFGLPIGGLTAILRSHKTPINKYREFCVAINPPNM